MRVPSLVLALCLVLLVRASSPSLVVQTTYGPVEGATTATNKVWLGIPFAAPPVGSLRWQPPIPPQSWTEVRDASTYGPACPQAASGLPAGTITSEDCLFIQVYAPLNSNPNSNLPVYFYIFGGGFRSGSPNKYDGQFIAGQDVITVVAAYRLGALGFIGHPLLRNLNNLNTTGNYGIQDQRLALQWVQDNIRSFGGNPDDVTIGGTSAGAGSVCMHLVAPRSYGYYHKAVMESAASCTTVPLSATSAYAQADQLMATLGCTGTDAQKLACFYAVTPDQLLTAFSGRPSPVQDAYELMESPLSLVRKGQFKKVPLIMGNQLNESSVNYCGGAPLTEAQFYAKINASSNAAVLRATYPLSKYPDPTAAANAVDTDSSFVCSAKSFEDAYSAQYPNIWVYNFNEYPFYASGGVGTRECLGSSHTFNLNFIIPSYYISRVPAPAPDPIWTPAETVLANKMRASWVNFIKTASPQVPQIGAEWPTYDFAEGHYLNIDLGDWWVGTHYKNDQCPAWGVASSDTSCEASIAIQQTHTGGWTSGADVYNQYTVTVTTGAQPVYAADLIIRFNIVPFTNGPFDSLQSYYGLTRGADGLYQINDWRLQSGKAVPPHTALTFGYVAKSAGPAVISVGTASCVAPPKDCHVDATLTLDGSWSDGQRFFQSYDFAFTNQGEAETDSLTVQLTLPSGSFPSQAWNLQTSQSQADIIASGSVTYSAPLWGLDPHHTSSSSGFILSSPVQNAAKPTFTVTSTTCL